jgi:hypothetical protein
MVNRKGYSFPDGKDVSETIGPSSILKLTSQFECLIEGFKNIDDDDIARLWALGFIEGNLTKAKR